MLTDHDRFEGVVLAAGMGTRMMPFSEHFPKPLLPVANRPLIFHEIDYLRSIGVRKVFIVIGHLGHEIVLGVQRGGDLGVEVEFVQQHSSLGTAHALMQLEQRIHHPFVLLLGDIYFEADGAVNPIECMRAQNAAGFLAVLREKDPRLVQRNFAVHFEPDGRVTRVVEKPRFPRTDWKGCGIYVFDVTIFDAIRRTPRSAARDEYELTDAIQIFMDDGNKVVAQPMVTTDINLTFPYDLLLANLSALRRIGRDNLVAPDAQVNPKATLLNCVIGPRARVTEPIPLRHCLVLPDAVVSTVEPVDREIFTPDRVVDCRHWIDGQGRLRGGEQAAQKTA